MGSSEGTYLGHALKARISRPAGRRLKPARFGRPEVVAAEKKMTSALHGAFVKLRAKVAADVRRALNDLRKAEGDEDEAWRLAGEVAEQLTFEQLAFVVDDIGSAADIAARTAGRETLGTIGVDDLRIVDQVDEAAAMWARDRSAELVGMRYDKDGNLVEAARAEMRIDESTRDMVRQVIYEGLVEGKRSTEIADELQHGTENADYPFSEERAALISNTEIRRAHNQGSLQGIRGARAAGSKVLKEWITSGHETVCDECELNESQGPIDPDDDFESGDDAAPAHPQCNCDVVPFLEEGEGDDEEDSEKLAKVLEAASAVAEDRVEERAEKRSAEQTEAILAKFGEAVERIAGLEREIADLRLSREIGADDRVEKLEADLSEALRSRDDLVERAAAEAREAAGSEIAKLRDDLVDERLAREALAAAAEQGAEITKRALDAAVSTMAEKVDALVAATKAPRTEEMVIDRLPGGSYKVVVSSETVE